MLQGKETAGLSVQVLNKASLCQPYAKPLQLVWDPHETTNIAKLERVQEFAARLVTGRWSEKSTPLREDLGWPLLAQWRLQQKLYLCKRILSEGSLISASCFQPNSSLYLRHANSKSLHRKIVTSNYHKIVLCKYNPCLE